MTFTKSFLPVPFLLLKKTEWDCIKSYKIKIYIHHRNTSTFARETDI